MGEAPPAGERRSSRLALNIAINVAVRGATLALMLVTLAVLVRWRGKAETGLLFLVFNLQGFFVLAGLGLPGAVVRAVATAQGAGDWRRAGALVTSAGMFFAVVGVLTALVLGLLAWGGMGAFSLEPHEVEPARRLIAMTAVWALLWWPAQILGQSLQGLRLFPQLGAATAVQALVGQGAMLVAALARAPLEVIYAAYLGGQVLGYGVQAVALARGAPRLRPTLRGAGWATLRPLAGTSVWLLASALAGLLIQQTDVVLLAMFVSSGAVALYTVIATPMMAVRELNGLVMGAVMPSAAEAGGGRDDVFLRGLALEGSRLHVAVMVGLIAAAAGTAYPALHVWMGPAMAANAPLCRLLLGAYAWSVGFTVLGHILMGTGRLRGLGLYSLASAAVNLALSLALVGPLGLWGVVLGTVGAYVLLAPWQVALFASVSPVPMGEYVARVLAPVYGIGAALAGVFWVWSWSLGPEPAPALAVLVVAAAGVICPLVMVAVCAPAGLRRLVGRTG